MNLSQHSITAVAKVITGDPPQSRDARIAPYRSGPELVSFFNAFREEDDQYGKGFPSRWMYAESCLSEINGSPAFAKVVEAAFDPRHFNVHDVPIQPAIDYVNPILEFDGYAVVKAGRRFCIRPLGTGVEVEPRSLRIRSGDPDDGFIREQLEKCDEKITGGDYDGAITNARSLVESVLLGLEATLTDDSGEYDGDLPKLFKRVQRAMNLEPDRADIAQPLKQVLGGLASVVYGLAPLRNRMSDAHARSYKPAEHHARFVVNAAKTAIHFVVSSYRYQQKKGLLVLKSTSSD